MLREAEPTMEVGTGPAGLPLSEIQQLIERNVRELGGGRIRHSAMNAYECIRTAWRIKGISPKMALVSAITGEEEAASSLILAVKQKQYPNSSGLNHRNHLHKASIYPLIVAANNAIAQTTPQNIQIQISKSGPPRIDVIIPLPDGRTAQPDNPLNFLAHSGGNPMSAPKLFESELARFASARGENTIVDALMRDANLRNIALYASDSGVPNISVGDTDILDRLQRIHVVSCVTIIVMQSADHQLMVTQCIDALTQMLPKIESNGFDYISIVRSVEGW